MTGALIQWHGFIWFLSKRRCTSMADVSAENLMGTERRCIGGRVEKQTF